MSLSEEFKINIDDVSEDIVIRTNDSFYEFSEDEIMDLTPVEDHGPGMFTVTGDVPEASSAQTSITPTVQSTGGITLFVVRNGSPSVVRLKTT